MATLRSGLRKARIETCSQVGSRWLATGKVDTGKILQKQDFKYCVDLVQNRDRESYLCGLLMPQKARRSYFAVRALNVELASIKDGGLNRHLSQASDTTYQPVVGPSTALTFRTQWWRDAIGQIYGDDIRSIRGGNPAHNHLLASMATSCWNNPVVRVLDYAVKDSQLTRRFIERLLEAREEDLAVKQLGTIDEAVAYAESTSSSLLYLSLETTGVSHAIYQISKLALKTP
jgi:NADH dehydrogenase [ubiquinone] 1 alpha subcomplex assembly factor 6